jgi:predicted dehydrogenase
MTGISLGLIGAGRVMGQHVEAMAAVPDLIPVAVADSRPEAAEALAEELGVPPYLDYRHLLADPRVEAVDIALPHDLHFEVAAAALAAGKHVVLDKPLATAAHEGEELVRLARANGRTLCVVHNLLFHPVIERMHELVAGGSLGQLRTAAAWSRGWLDIPPWDFRLSRERTGGGVWVDNAPHLLYVLEALVGPVRDCVVFAAGGPSRLGGEDSLSAAIAFDSGVTATVRISYAEGLQPPDVGWPRGWSLGFDIGGHAGWVAADVIPAPRIRWRLGDGDVVEEHPVVPFSASFAGVLRDFATAVTTGAPLRVEPEAALELLRETLRFAPQPGAGA